MLLPSQSSLWVDKLQKTEKTISNTTWSLQTGFEFRGGGAASSGKSSSLSLLLGRGWKMTHMHCGLDKNRPLHRSTNPARMRLNVWSMVITSCREQCPPPGLQQRKQWADEQEFTSACFLCAELFLLCNKWEKTRDEVRTRARHAAGRCLCSLHSSCTACTLNSAFNCLKGRNPPHPHTKFPLWTRPRSFFYLFQMFLAILNVRLFLFNWEFLTICTNKSRSASYRALIHAATLAASGMMFRLR